VPSSPHPLDPLGAEEVREASAVLRRERGLGPSARFVSVALHEPPKQQVMDLAPGQVLDRQAFLVLYDRGKKATSEAVVSLTSGTVVSWRDVPGVQPSYMLEEFARIEKAVRSDERWQEAMRKRDVTDLSMAMIDPWPAGYLGPQDDPSAGRKCRPLTFLRVGSRFDHGYARPIEGLICTVDLDTFEVTEVADHGVVPLPERAGNYEPDLFEPGNWPPVERLRDDVKPIEITQPEGPSFTVDGWAVEWQKWRLRIGYHPREGLLLHQVGYLDGGRVRPILYRASLSEMFVPYGDPAPTHSNKNVFDEGEAGLGALANSLELGCDCLGEIRYFDAVVNDTDGNPHTLPNAICMHEEDAGIAWKHTDWRTERVAVRRLRRLVISTIATVGNYEYGFFWYLYNDGSIEYEIKLTGVISTGAVGPGVTPEYGTLVAPGLYGPNHQHFFNVRLDMTVDGTTNSVYEVDAAPVPAGPGNPLGNAWKAVPRLLAGEGEAQRDIAPMVGRQWTIVNPDVVNPLGQPVAYKLVPGENVAPQFQPGSYPDRRGGFARHHLWVTAYDPAERYAAGDYPWQNAGGDGLPAYAAADRPLESADVVIWYSFGAHHVVRPEDWPVMPVARIGFHLKPSGFFMGNPALDLPSDDACHT
jgi:primary-amine oxidase